MAIVKFLGRVLPPSMHLTLRDLPSIRWEEHASGLVIDSTISIDDSQVEVTCNSNKYDTDADYTQVHMRALDIARAAVDCFSYANGFGLTVVLEVLVQPDGVRRNILVQDPRLPPMVTAFSSVDGVAFNQVFGIVVSDPHVFMALNDLIMAISLPHYGPTNCARVVESLRNAMSPIGANIKNRNPAWEFMRQNLNISEDFLYFITKESEGPRHGQRIGTQQAAFTETIDRTWEIMNRFREFRKRGNQKLPDADFPLLT